MIDDVKRVPAGWIAGVVVADIGLTWAVVSLVFPSGILGPVSEATGGLLNPTLAVNLPLLALVVGGLILGAARLGPSGVGLRRGQLVRGLVGALAFWTAVQLVLLIHALGIGRELAWNPRWSAGGLTLVIGALLAQLLGSALREEIVYRGFLIPQLALHLDGRLRSRAAVLALAVLGAALVFAAMHVPNVIRIGLDPGPQFLIHTFNGVVFGLLYIFTGNLFFVIGVHALGNWGMPLLDPGIEPGMVTFVLRVVLVLGLGVVALRRRRQTPASL